jgi:hypothetical protein
MNPIICDTNIWYDISNNRIDFNKLQSLQLIGTSVNIIEFSTSPNLINNIELVINAIRAFTNYHHQIIITNPFEYLIALFNEDYIPSTKAEETLLQGFNILLNMDVAKIPNENIIEAKKRVNRILSIQQNIIDKINIGLPPIREKIKKLEGKKKHHKIDFSTIWKQFISELISDYSKKSNEKEYKIEIHDTKWGFLELFIHTWESYFKILEIEKRRFDKNDWADLFNLVYVQPGYKYWTSEKKWNKIFEGNNRLNKYKYNVT